MAENIGFFLKRPVFSTVISLAIMLMGVMAIRALPIAQYPDLIPPQIVVSASYPGASAETIASSVAAPLEAQINGVDDMLYMNSLSSSSGSMTINVFFNVGTNPDMALVNVNNRVQLAQIKLPEDVRRQGVQVTKRSSSILEIVTLYSPEGRFSELELHNYALVNLIDDIKRLEGVGDASIFGSMDYAMRIWLRPDILAQHKLIPDDVVKAITDQNAQFAPGRIADMPTSNEIILNMQIDAKGRLSTPEEFGNIIIRSDPDGAALRVKDVARVELGAQDYSVSTKLNGKPSRTFGVYLAPGANALETTDRVAAKMAELGQRFPAGMEYSIPFDTTRFVRISIREVIHTLIEAMILVFLVVFIFLQDWRATIIPCLAVPVSIIGTFAGIYALGFSINTLTLFALVLAIGIVVDDAIVVLENVERIMAQEKLPPRAATAKAMREVTGPVIAIVLVLSSVFIPVAFMGGLSGQMYKQFAITIAISVTISGIVALTMTPAMCVIFLREKHAEPFRIFKFFNKGFEKVTNIYLRGVRHLLHRPLISFALFAGFLLATFGIFRIVPGGLTPDEDQGYVLGVAMLPDGASAPRSTAFEAKLEAGILKNPDIDQLVTIRSLDLLTSSVKSNYVSFFLILKHWDERVNPEQSSFSIVKDILKTGAMLPEGRVLAFNPPAISGMGNTGGFELFLQNRGAGNAQDLYDMAQKLTAAAAQSPELQGVTNLFSISTPEIYLNLDRDRCMAMGVPVSAVFSAMQATFGSRYVNDFNLMGRTFRVIAQAESSYRSTVDKIKEVYVRNNNGDMIPITALVKIEQRVGPQAMERFNIFPAAHFTGGPAPGYSSGQAIAAMEKVAAEVLTEDFTIDWSGSALQEKLASQSTTIIFALAIIMVFLILSAQYESWALPLAVLTAVPFAIFGAILFTWIRGLNNDVYFQISMVTLIGLAAKNAILIVEFATVKYRQEGLEIAKAAAEGARLRFRPIVMTSLAFILGCLPLATSSGAGAASRHAIGTGIIGGMLAATCIATLFVPFFFRAILEGAAKIRSAIIRKK